MLYVQPANKVALTCRYWLEVLVRLMYRANGMLCNLWQLKLLASCSAYKYAYVEAIIFATT